MRRGVTRSIVTWVGALTILLSSACDSGPRGAATWNARVTSSEGLGAVVLEVVGTGIEGFGGRGDTRIYTAPVSGEPERHRVVLVSPVGGELRFSIEVGDAGRGRPAVSVVSAVDAANRVIAGSGVGVSLESVGVSP